MSPGIRQHQDGDRTCWMQVLNLEAVANGKRYKCLLSDGGGSVDAILGSEAAKLATAGEINEGAVITMQDYVLNVINDAQKLVVTGEPTCSQQGLICDLLQNALLWSCRAGLHTVNDCRWKASAGCTLAESRPAPAADEIEDLGNPTKNGKAVMNDRGSGRLIADAMLQAAQW